jgi:hypothetical protein
VAAPPATSPRKRTFDA